MNNQSNVTNSRRGLTDPIGDIGNGVTKVVSIATEVPAKVSSVVEVIETEIAKLLSFELDAGTRHASVHVGGKPIQIWPPSGAMSVTDLPLSSKQQEPIKSIVKAFNEALSIDLGNLVGLLIFLAILSACAVIGLGIELHLTSGRCCGMVVWFSLILVGLTTSGTACYFFWFLYHSLNVIISVARDKNLTVETGAAIQKARYTFLASAVQGGVSFILCFLSVMHKAFGRRSKLPGKNTNYEKSSPRPLNMAEYRPHNVAAPGPPHQVGRDPRDAVTKPEAVHLEGFYQHASDNFFVKEAPKAGGRKSGQF